MGVVQLGVRVPPDVKAAIEEAAKEEARTTASLVTKILLDWLKHRAGANEKALRRRGA